MILILLACSTMWETLMYQLTHKNMLNELLSVDYSSGQVALNFKYEESWTSDHQVEITEITVGCVFLARIANQLFWIERRQQKGRFLTVKMQKLISVCIIPVGERSHNKNSSWILSTLWEPGDFKIVVRSYMK